MRYLERTLWSIWANDNVINFIESTYFILARPNELLEDKFAHQHFLSRREMTSLSCQPRHTCVIISHVCVNRTVLESVWCLSFSRMKTHKGQWCASNLCFFWVLWWVGHHFQPDVHLVFYLEKIRRVIALNVLPMTIWRKDSRNFERKFGFNSISLPKSKSLTLCFKKYIWKFLHFPFLFEATQEKY